MSYSVQILFRPSSQAGNDYLVCVTRDSDGVELRDIAYTRLGARFKARKLARFGFRYNDKMDAKQASPTRYVIR